MNKLAGRSTVVATTADVEREIVRMLWTFHFATQDQLSRLIWNDAAPMARRRLKPALTRLLTMHMIWREPRRTLPGYSSHTHGQASGGWYYGLTEAGKAWGSSRMPELRGLHCITREGYLSDPDRRTITHSVHCSEYCARLIQYLRTHPLAVGMFFETESTVLGAHLRMDCLLRLRLHRQAPPGEPRAPARPPWYVPWLPTLRTPTLPRTLDATFALEIDESSEHRQVLEDKALNYRRTFAYGLPGGQQVLAALGAEDVVPTVHWQTVLCPMDAPEPIEARLISFPIPVFVMKDEGRLATVWQAWSRGWPDAEVRMTTWALLNAARSLLSAPYLNQERRWVDLLGSPLDDE